MLEDAGVLAEGDLLRNHEGRIFLSLSKFYGNISSFEMS